MYQGFLKMAEAHVFFIIEALNWNTIVYHTYKYWSRMGQETAPEELFSVYPCFPKVVSTHTWASFHRHVQRIQIIILKLRHGSTRWNGPFLATIPGLDQCHLFGLSCEPQALMRKPERGLHKLYSDKPATTWGTPLLTRWRSWLKDTIDLCKSKSQLWGQLQKTTYRSFNMWAGEPFVHLAPEVGSSEDAEPHDRYAGAFCSSGSPHKKCRLLPWSPWDSSCSGLCSAAASAPALDFTHDFTH